MPTIGTVHLRVADLEHEIAYYQQHIGLQVLRRTTNPASGAPMAYLGAGQRELLALIHTPEGRRYAGTTGLYHFALLVPTRRDLARTLKHLYDARTPLQGMSDHHVSEALYLGDAEDNGIEIYADRPREQWRKNGQFHMDTVRLDTASLARELDGSAGQWQGLPDGTVMGHIHLHVANIPDAVKFYQAVLGMDLMMNYGPSAAFLSYEGYHHHVGVNTWAGRTPPPADALGLSHYELHMPDGGKIPAMLDAARELNLPIQENAAGWMLQDPAANRIQVMR